MTGHHTDEPLDSEHQPEGEHDDPDLAPADETPVEAPEGVPLKKGKPATEDFVDPDESPFDPPDGVALS